MGLHKGTYQGQNIGLHHGTHSGERYAYTPQARKIFNKFSSLGVPANAERKRLINNTVASAINAKVWYKGDALQMYVAHAKLAALVDWRNTDRMATILNEVSTTYVPDQYIKGNNTSTVLDTNFNPGDGSVYNFKRDSNFCGVYFTESKAENKTDLSCLDAGSNGYELNWFPSSGIGGQWTYKAGTGTAVVETNVLNPIGFVAVQRTGATVSTMYKNGFLTDADISAVASVAPPNRSIKLLARDTNGTFSNWSTKKIAYFAAGSGDIDTYILNNIISKEYLNPLGICPQKRVTIQGNSYINALLLPSRVRLNLGYPGFDFNQHGTGGYTTAQLLAEAPNFIFNRANIFYTRDVYVVQELTNGFAVSGADAAAVISEYNTLVALATLAKSSGRKVVVNTMPPRNSIGTGNNFRQNDANLLDPATLNGMIRNTPLGLYWDAVADLAGDPVYGVWSHNVAGVGELNLTNYADGIHLTTSGYNYYADTYLTPAINSLLV